MNRVYRIDMTATESSRRGEKAQLYEQMEKILIDAGLWAGKMSAEKRMLRIKFFPETIG